MVLTAPDQLLDIAHLVHVLAAIADLKLELHAAAPAFRNQRLQMHRRLWRNGYRLRLRQDAFNSPIRLRLREKAPVPFLFVLVQKPCSRNDLMVAAPSADALITGAAALQDLPRIRIKVDIAVRRIAARIVHTVFDGCRHMNHMFPGKLNAPDYTDLLRMVLRKFPYLGADSLFTGFLRQFFHLPRSAETAEIQRIIVMFISGIV